ncbi:MAG: D-alanyl-D-alanine endopeptidase [Gammaproteobacteria bacterium]|nr:D-alanyl-D-alanine endopeptidase [Gammaproteobacteria bacterium]MBK9427114.1 D-alanyl-D-alanine endopeptidase [Gammaproteobacteria bacterium]
MKRFCARATLRSLLAATLALGALAAGGVEAANRPQALQLQSRAVLVMRADTGEVLYRKNAEETLPIASITKLMTAMVVLDAKQSLDAPIRITNAEVDRLRGSSSRLAIGTTVTRRQALILALMSSENRAAAALLRNYPGGKAAGVAAMNRKARALGMTHSRFVEATGLSGDNRSTPSDLARMVKAASRYPDIRKFSTTRELTVKVGRYPTLYRNSNPLVRNPSWNIDITKTGYLSEAGRCLVMQTTIRGMPVVMVLMNSWGTYTRVGDAGRVRRWLETSAPAQLAARR